MSMNREPSPAGLSVWCGDCSYAHLNWGFSGWPTSWNFTALLRDRYPFLWSTRGAGNAMTVPDELQLCAQAMCLEEMLQIAVPEGAVYYGQPRRRQLVSLDAILRDGVRRLCERARQLYEGKLLPPPVHAHHCINCSLLSVCMPELGGKDRSKAYVDDIVRNIAEVI